MYYIWTDHCRTISHALHIKQDGVVDIIYSTATSINISASILIASLVLMMF